MICVLCEKEFAQYEMIECGEHSFISKGGHNPAPLAEKGRCCSKCNYGKVLPARLEVMYNPKNNLNEKR
jgi:hypothetical protein